MKIKLLRSVLVGDADVTPTTGGTELDMEEAKAREFIALGLADEAGVKKSAPHSNKMEPEPDNKGKRKAKADE